MFFCPGAPVGEKQSRAVGQKRSFPKSGPRIPAGITLTAITSHCPVGDLAASNIFFRPSIPDMASTFLRQSPTSTGRSCQGDGDNGDRGWEQSTGSPTAPLPIAQSQPLPSCKCPLHQSSALSAKGRCSRELWMHEATNPKLHENLKFSIGG